MEIELSHIKNSYWRQPSINFFKMEQPPFGPFLGDTNLSILLFIDTKGWYKIKKDQQVGPTPEWNFSHNKILTLMPNFIYVITKICPILELKN